MKLRTWMVAGMLGLFLTGLAEAATLTLILREPPKAR